MKAENYDEAENSFTLVLELYAPPETQLVLTRFNQLLADQIHELNLTRISIDHASEYIKWLMDAEAQEAYQAVLDIEPDHVEAKRGLAGLP